MDKKRDVVNYKLLVYITLFLLIIPIVFAGFYDGWINVFNIITGRATSGTADLNITVSGSSPTVDAVFNVSFEAANPSITLAGILVTNISFTATDTDGVGNLNDTAAIVNFQRSGGVTRSNTSCVLVGDLDANTANYSCEVDIYYYDGSGSWTINASILDNNNNRADNTSMNFTLQETTGMVIFPTNLTWASLALTDENSTANENITINNTANKDIAAGGINVTAYNLTGETITTDFIPAANFSVSDKTGSSEECFPTNASRAKSLVDSSSQNVTTANITAGNNTAYFQSDNTTGGGVESIFFCLLPWL